MGFGKYTSTERKMRRDINSVKNQIRYHKFRIIRWEKKLIELENSLKEEIKINQGMLKKRKITTKR